MAKTTDAKANPKLDDLIAALLVIAGGWYILNQALKAAEAKQKPESPVDGAEWAKTVLAEIDRAKKDNGERETEPGE